MDYNQDEKPSSQTWIQLLNIISAISTITGVTLISIQKTTNLSFKDIFAYGFSILIGLTVFTFAIGIILHKLRSRWDNIRNNAKYGVQMLLICGAVISGVLYIVYVMPTTIDITYNLLSKLPSIVEKR